MTTGRASQPKQDAWCTVVVERERGPLGIVSTKVFICGKPAVITAGGFHYCAVHAGWV